MSEKPHTPKEAETLERAAKEQAEDWYTIDPNGYYQNTDGDNNAITILQQEAFCNGFECGANWQLQQPQEGYTESEVRKIVKLVLERAAENALPASNLTAPIDTHYCEIGSRCVFVDKQSILSAEYDDILKTVKQK